MSYRTGTSPQCMDISLELSVGPQRSGRPLVRRTSANFGEAGLRSHRVPDADASVAIQFGKAA